MILTYIIVLCFSTGFLAWAGLRSWRRIAALVHRVAEAGSALLTPMLAFLIVVGAPPPMLVGALLLVGVMALGGLYAEKPAVRGTLLLTVALLGATGLHAPLAPYLQHLPLLVALVMAVLVWFVLTATGLALPQTAGWTLFGGLAATLAVGTARLQVPSGESVTTDAAIMASALAGVLLARGDRMMVALPVRVTFAFLLAYLQVAAFWQGAWLPALLSLAIWLGTIGWAWTRQADGWEMRHG